MGHKRQVRRVATLEASSLDSSVARRRNPAVIRLVPALKRRAIIKVSLRDTEICGCGSAALGSSVAKFPYELEIKIIAEIPTKSLTGALRRVYREIIPWE